MFDTIVASSGLDDNKLQRFESQNEWAEIKIGKERKMFLESSDLTKTPFYIALYEKGVGINQYARIIGFKQGVDSEKIIIIHDGKIEKIKKPIMPKKSVQGRQYHYLSDILSGNI